MYAQNRNTKIERMRASVTCLWRIKNSVPWKIRIKGFNKGMRKKSRRNSEERLRKKEKEYSEGRVVTTMIMPFKILPPPI